MDWLAIAVMSDVFDLTLQDFELPVEVADQVLHVSLVQLLLEFKDLLLEMVIWTPAVGLVYFLSEFIDFRLDREALLLSSQFGEFIDLKIARLGCRGTP